MAMRMTTKSGNWNDPTVWGGAVPTTGDMAHILAGHEINYNIESDAVLDEVMTEVGSKLTWSSAAPTRLRVNTIMARGIVSIVDEAAHSTAGAARHEIIFHPNATAPGTTMNLGAVFMGPTRIHGYKKKGHLRSANNVIAGGATTITLTGLANSGWRVGDTILILGTEYVTPATTDPQSTIPYTSYWGKYQSGSTYSTRPLDEFQFGQDEERTIMAINGDVVTLSSALTYSHTGMTGTLADGKVITVRPVVANVTRSIRFRMSSSADLSDSQQRAHLMFMRQPDIDLRYFESRNLGRTRSDVTLHVDNLPYVYEVAGGTGTAEEIKASSSGASVMDSLNVRGRYGIHVHWCGGPYIDSPQVNLIGASCWAPKAEVPLPGWGIVHHSSRAAIEDCVVSNVRGAGMVSEVGNEIGQWVGNVVTGCRGDGDRHAWGTRQETHTNHNGSSGVAYENQSRAILMHGNIAGSSKHGWLYHHQKSFRQPRGLRDVDLRFVDGLVKGASGGTYNEMWLDELIGHQATQIPPFLDNECHAVRHGFMVVHRIGKESGHVKTPMLMERFHCLNVPFAYNIQQYSNTYYQRDCLWQAPSGMAGTIAVNLGTVSWDWNFANIHLRNYELGFRDDKAHINYEGFFIDITTENVGSFAYNPEVEWAGNAQHPALNSHPIKNVMGDWLETGTNKAKPRVWKNILSSTLPSPYPLEPYGRKLPSGHPAVPIGGTPYFVLGDGTNGAASTVPVTMALTLNAGSGRDQGRFYGIIRDSVGDRRYPDFQHPESFPQNTAIVSHRTLGKLTPEQLVQRWGCWLDGSTWKCRAWFLGADRFTLKRFAFHVDFTLNGFEPAFLTKHDLGGPSTAPEWPDKLEAVPATQRPLTALARTLKFLSRTTLQNVAGQPLAHRLRPNVVNARLEIAGGTNASEFAIDNGTLTWVSGTRTAGNTYTVNISATDNWGNTVTTAHTVAVVSSSRVSASITDSFTGTAGTELTTHNANYVMLDGPSSGFALNGSGRLSTVGAVAATVDLGSLGTSQQELFFEIPTWSDATVLFRLVDANNWLGFRRQDWPSNTMQLRMCVAGAQSTLAQFANQNQNKVQIRCVDNRVFVYRAGGSATDPKPLYPTNQTSMALQILDLDHLAEPGAMVLPANAPLGTKVGLWKPGNAVSGWLDNFSAAALAS